MTRTISPYNADVHGIGSANNVILFEAYNYSGTTVKITLEVYMAVGDDHAYGYFLGAGPAEVLLKREKREPKIHYTEEEAGIIENIGRAVENALPLIEDVTEVLNSLDAHPISYQPYPIKDRRMGYTVANNQIQYLERLGMTTQNGMNITTPEDFGTKRRETDIYDLCTSTYHWNNLVSWNTSSASGSILASDQIGPNPQIGTAVQAPCDFFSRDFNYWTGGLVYVFEVIATQMHRGRLVITFHPNLTNPPSDLQLATQQYFTSIDLSEGRGIVAITFPYLQKTPYKLIKSANLLASEPVSNFINGSWALRVQNPLRATNNVSTTVDINIYKFAAQDFEMKAYGNINFLCDPFVKTIKEEKPEKKTVKTITGIQSKTPAQVTKPKRF